MARRVLAIISLILLLSTMAQAQSRPVSTGRSAALSKAAITDSCSGADINLIWIDSTQYGLEPHVTDGTVAGTHLLKDLEPGREGSGAQDCFELQGQLYFQTGRFVWRTNGSANGTTRIYSTPPGSFLGQMGYFRGRIYLVSSNELGATVYSFLPDGSDFQPAYITPQGAATKKELELTVGADAVYILEYTLDHGGEVIGSKLIRTVGTRQSTSVVRGFDAATGLTLTKFRDGLAFIEYAARPKLWVGRGKEWNELSLRGYSFDALASFGVVNGRLILSGTLAAGEHLVLSTDGTQPGTIVLPLHAAVVASHDVDDALYLDTTKDSHCQLWRTDGVSVTAVRLNVARAKCGYGIFEHRAELTGKVIGAVDLKGGTTGLSVITTNSLGQSSEQILLRDGGGNPSILGLSKQVIMQRALPDYSIERSHITDGTVDGTHPFEFEMDRHDSLAPQSDKSPIKKL